MGPHAYFGGLFSLDENLSDAKYAVFDDMQGGLEFFHAYKFWMRTTQSVCLLAIFILAGSRVPAKRDRYRDWETDVGSNAVRLGTVQGNRIEVVRYFILCVIGR